MDKKVKARMAKLQESITPDKAHAYETLSQFSKEVVTLKSGSRLLSRQPWYMHLYNFISTPFMDAKGILTAAKVLGLVVVLGLIAVFLSVTDVGKNLVKNNIAQVTPKVTTTATPTPTVALADSSVEDVLKQVDATTAEIDNLQKELDDMAATFSTKDVDTLSTQLDGIK